MTQTREDFLAARKLGIGGSDVPAILGLSRYRSALHVYLEKRGELPGEEEKWNEQGKMFGTRCEDIACKLFSEKTGRRIRKRSKPYIAKGYPFIRGNIDRLQWDLARPSDRIRGVLEAKWLDASQYSVWTKEGVPEGYYLQLQSYLLCTGLQWGSFVVVFGGNKLEFFDIERDEPLIQRLIEVASEFWDRVITGRPPDLSFDELGKALLTRLYPKQIPGKEMILDDEEATAKARRLFALTETVKQRQQSLLELEVWFKEKMGDAEKLLVPTVATFTWKAQSTTRMDVDKLRSDYPVEAKACEKSSDSRVFRKTVLKTAEIDIAELEKDEMIITAPQAARRFSFNE